MDKELVMILDSLQGAVLAVDELNSCMPDVKLYLEEYQKVLVQLEKTKLELIELIKDSSSIKDDLKKQFGNVERELNKQFVSSESKINAAIDKILKIQTDIEKKTTDIPDMGEINIRIANVENYIKEIGKKISKIEKEISNSVNLEKIQIELQADINKKYEELSQRLTIQEMLVKNVGKSSVGNISIRSTSNSVRKDMIPAECLSFALNAPKSVKRTKPYCVVFEESGNIVNGDKWTVITEAMVSYFIENIARDKGKRLKDSTQDDGWGHYYFYEGMQSGYTYIHKHNISVYKAGSEESIEIFKYMCDEYGVNQKKVRVYYKN